MRIEGIERVSERKTLPAALRTSDASPRIPKKRKRKKKPQDTGRRSFTVGEDGSLFEDIIPEISSCICAVLLSCPPGGSASLEFSISCGDPDADDIKVLAGYDGSSCCGNAGEKAKPSARKKRKASFVSKQLPWLYAERGGSLLIPFSAGGGFIGVRKAKKRADERDGGTSPRVSNLISCDPAYASSLIASAVSEAFRR